MTTHYIGEEEKPWRLHIANVIYVTKNPAYGGHQICQPMRIEAPIIFMLKKREIYPERLIVFKAPTVKHLHAWTFHGCNLE